jgi:hypothetical protein
MYEGDTQEQLRVTLHDMQIIEIACRKLSPEALEQKIDAFFYDFLDDEPSDRVLIDISILPQKHAEAFFRGFMDIFHERGFSFGFLFLDQLSDYQDGLIPIDHYPLRQFSRHLLEDIAVQDLPVELRDYKFAGDLGL